MNDLTWFSIKTLIVSPTLGEKSKTARTGTKSPNLRPELTFNHFVLYWRDQGDTWKHFALVRSTAHVTDFLGKSRVGCPQRRSYSFVLGGW